MRHELRIDGLQGWVPYTASVFQLMRYDLYLPKSIDLIQHPGQVIVAIPVRAPWEFELDKHAVSPSPSSEAFHGREGVWYHPDDVGNDLIELEPREPISGDELVAWKEYVLTPIPIAPPHQMRTHRYLIRWWWSAVYVATVKTDVVSLLEVHNEEGRCWSFNTEHFQIAGIDYQPPQV